MIQLRHYQQAAVQAVYDHLRTRDDHPCVVIPTGGGKTAVIAQLCRDAVQHWNGRVLVLAHVKELLEQSATTLRRCAPNLPVGVYSAGLRSRDTQAPVIVAGIQSVYKRADELDAFDLILVDEAHLLPPDGEGMYQTFLSDARLINPQLRLIGLTATPYRLKSGLLCGTDHLLNHICFEIGVKELIVQGFLSALKTKAGRKKANYQDLHVRQGEFISSEVESLVDTDELVGAACREIAAATADRHSVLIFAASVAHAQHIQTTLQALVNQECAVVTGETPPAIRDQLIDRFKGRAVPSNLFGDSLPPLKYLINVNVLTTGFDAPNVDCVVLLRPTASPGLYYQMVGRGFRLHPGKQDCLVLDYGDNILRHGPVDAIQVVARKSGSGDAPAKECPKCQTLVHAAFTICPECGFNFPPPEKNKHAEQASNAGILSGEITDTEYDVQEVAYHIHVKRVASENTPRTMRVDYRIGLDHWQSEWVCLEHQGFARQKAISWWRQRSPDPVPDLVERAVQIANAGGLAYPVKITVRDIAGEKYSRIISCELGPLPDPVDPEHLIAWDEEEVPF
ncbi:MAG: DEAD/DEAH box helicase family protein [Pirellulaceae bacterium]|nr:DEAD/DEAH box helicase family protein [Pirellulaceae bacterium]